MAQIEATVENGKTIVKEIQNGKQVDLDYAARQYEGYGYTVKRIPGGLELSGGQKPVEQPAEEKSSRFKQVGVVPGGGLRRRSFKEEEELRETGTAVPGIYKTPETTYVTKRTPEGTVTTWEEKETVIEPPKVELQAPSTSFKKNLAESVSQIALGMASAVPNVLTGAGGTLLPLLSPFEALDKSVGSFFSNEAKVIANIFTGKTTPEMMRSGLSRDIPGAIQTVNTQIGGVARIADITKRVLNEEPYTKEEAIRASLAVQQLSKDVGYVSGALIGAKITLVDVPTYSMRAAGGIVNAAQMLKTPQFGEEISGYEYQIDVGGSSEINLRIEKGIEPRTLKLTTLEGSSRIPDTFQPSPGVSFTKTPIWKPIGAIEGIDRALTGVLNRLAMRTVTVTEPLTTQYAPPAFDSTPPEIAHMGYDIAPKTAVKTSLSAAVFAPLVTIPKLSSQVTTSTASKAITKTITRTISLQKLETTPTTAEITIPKLAITQKTAQRTATRTVTQTITLPKQVTQAISLPVVGVVTREYTRTRTVTPLVPAIRIPSFGGGGGIFLGKKRPSTPSRTKAGYTPSLAGLFSRKKLTKTPTLRAFSPAKIRLRIKPVKIPRLRL